MATTARLATPADARAIGRLLDAFNREYDDITPGAEVLAQRCAKLLASDEMSALVAGDGPDGVVVLRFRPSFWTGAPEAYLEELYVAPELRGRGLGRALLDGALELSRERGAEYIGLGTATDDIAALGLYESAGFTNREGRPDGPSMLWYELEL
jgi:ribosomal protein S18 acetylase RimI-like enzyme